MAFLDQLRAFELRTRPVDPHTEAALKRRWNELPEQQRMPSQVLGRRTTGCEGTHGVFPKCNFSCKPCYHSADANKVRVDGPHTLEMVERQMQFMQQTNATTTYAQLIGGEVSLLEPRDHAEALAIMHRYGRKPMSFTHGDFDYEYLRQIVVDDAGQPRFSEVSFACHMDTTMVGRQGAQKPQSEAELNDFRGRFCDMFDRLQSEYGVRSFLAHNMTVTPGNIDEVADVVAACATQGWRLFSFQPAAYIGNEHRWREGYRELTSDLVWSEVERGAGSRLPYDALHVGDTRCTRSTWGAWVGDSYVPAVDDRNQRDRDFVALMLEAFPGNMIGSSKLTAVTRIVRSVAASPRVVPESLAWARRFGNRAGGLRAGWSDVRPMTFVMHQFIDAVDSAAAWEHMQAGTRSDDERINEAQERLEACAYIMGHPETGQSVPACVQHAVLDQQENRELVQLLPLPTRKTGSQNPGAIPVP